MTALFVSPHLDDVAFSCSGTLAGIKRGGGRVVLATVFTRSVPNPAGFALACQIDKGLSPEVDYLAIRRHEDADFARELDVDRVEWLDLSEAPHRGYDSAPSLFAGVRDDDEVAVAVVAKLGALIEQVEPDWIFAPQAIGNHADHLQVIRAILTRPDWLARIAWYRDLPYASKFPTAQAAPELPGNLVEVAFPLDPRDLAAKIAGSTRYATQVPFQFGNLAAVESVLGGFGRAEGQRLGQMATVEALLIEPEARDRWAGLLNRANEDNSRPG